MNRRSQTLAATLAFCWAVLLNLRFFISAGPLWRDEANSVQQACLPGWDSVFGSLRYDSFPILYPAVLRVWTSIPSLNSDLALRVLGLVTGLSLLISIFLVCRMLGSRTPVVALVLLGVDPILISEACSVRPYGLTLIALLWAFGAIGMCYTRASGRWILVASISSILSVQLSYNSAFFIAAFSLAAVGLALWRGERRAVFLLFLPGLLAALTLLPYWNILEQARSWVVLLHYHADWAQFFSSYLKEHTFVPLVVWGVFLALACFAVPFRRQRPYISGDAILPYTVAAAVLCLICQVLFVEFAKVPPFPRYFLPVLLFTGIALQLVLAGRPRISHDVLAVIALFVTAWPAWSWLGLQRTNVDRVAQVLGREARAGDLVILSPWFLHPAFQRYYKGPADWITVPDLPVSPITRYDLFMQAMFRTESAGGLYSHLAATLSRGGRLWLVYQAIGQVPDRDHPPEVPSPSSIASGEDYVRWRSYWEREIWFLLRSCCHPRELPVSGSRCVWVEERLLLAMWSPTDQEGESRLQNPRK